MDKFIDFDRRKGLFYDNLWLNQEKLVIKVPLACEDYASNPLDIKIEEFTLSNSYLMHY
jgi:hypothetical protein